MRLRDLPNLGYNPGGFKLSAKKLKTARKISGNFFNRILILSNISKIQRTLKRGDTQMAKVVSTSPLLIASYSDEFDTIIMLKFPEKYVEMYDLEVNDRLVSTNTYLSSPVYPLAKDIFRGPDTSLTFIDIYPMIPLFLSDNISRCIEATKYFPEEYWDYLDELISYHMTKRPNVFRDGMRSLIHYGLPNK